MLLGPRGGTRSGAVSETEASMPQRGERCQAKTEVFPEFVPAMKPTAILNSVENSPKGFPTDIVQATASSFSLPRLGGSR